MDLNQINKTAELSNNNSMSLMVFKLVSKANPDYRNFPYFAINIFKVKEVLNTADYEINSVPTQSNYLQGVISVRGEYISIYNLNEWLGFPPFESDRSVYIVTELNGKRFGLHVAHISGVEEKSWDEIVPSTNNSDKIVNQTQLGGGLCLIVDVEKMINEITGINLEEQARTERINEQMDKVILYADDQKSMRDYLGMTLENLGFKAIGFEDGQGIVDYLQNSGSEQVLLVITDLEMPRLSGHSVIKYIKESEHRQLPVLVHSSMTVNDSQRQAKSMGADDFIGKVSTENIKKALEKYVG